MIQLRSRLSCVSSEVDADTPHGPGSPAWAALPLYAGGVFSSNFLFSPPAPVSKQVIACSDMVDLLEYSEFSTTHVCCCTPDADLGSDRSLTKRVEASPRPFEAQQLVIVAFEDGIRVTTSPSGDGAVDSTLQPRQWWGSCLSRGNDKPLQNYTGSLDRGVVPATCWWMDVPASLSYRIGESLSGWIYWTDKGAAS